MVLQIYIVLKMGGGLCVLSDFGREQEVRVCRMIGQQLKKGLDGCDWQNTK